MSTLGVPALASVPARARIDRPVLIGNLVSGGLWLLVPVGLGSWPLALVGAPHVIAGSVFLAAVYARGPLTIRQEALAWATPWLTATALWTVLLGLIGAASASDWLAMVGVALVIATPCYLGWQLLALAVRQLIAWLIAPQSGPAPSR